MICPHCQVRLEEDAIFCHWCGGKIDSDEARRQEEEKAALARQAQAQVQKVVGNRYYQLVFSFFEAHGGKFILSWNWPAFLFGVLWYLFKGMWAKALLMFLLGLLFGGEIAPLLWLYAGLCGNWDYYLLKVKKTQFWV